MSFLRHLRLGLRHSLRRPGESAAIVVVLGLGIGLAATAWAVVWGTYLRALPFPGRTGTLRPRCPDHRVAAAALGPATSSRPILHGGGGGPG